MSSQISIVRDITICQSLFYIMISESTHIMILTTVPNLQSSVNIIEGHYIPLPGLNFNRTSWLSDTKPNFT